MKKITGLIVLGLVSVSVFLLGFDYRTTKEPNTFYHVYLNEKIIGTINSKEELESFIDRRGEFIKKQYNVEKVYSPEGLEINRINTFSNKVDSVEKVYNAIEKVSPFTIRGYQLTLKDEFGSRKIFVTSEEVFENAISDTIKTFVGGERYDEYVNDNQKEILTTGKNIDNIFIQEDITIKELNIPTSETIYNDSKDLAQFLIFGETADKTEYVVKPGDTIEMVSFNNEISVEEFLISNDNFTSEKNLLFPGQKVTIGVTDPQVRVVLKEFVIEDLINKHKTEYIVDSSMFVGDRRVERQGVDGVIRVSQNITIVNGTIIEVSDPLSSQEVVSPINSIIRIGGKSLPVNVGKEGWAWPTNAGWRITSAYGYRIHPVTGQRELHNGTDIAGTGFNSNIYAANDGVVTSAGNYGSYGITVVINHNNGYYTLYSHLNSFTIRVGDVVAKGQVIGKMGRTGRVTGTHLHFSFFSGNPFGGGSSINAMRFY